MMIGGLKRSSSSLAIVAAAGLFAGGTMLTPAQAADLGGDCCADLEERVAELEATSVRHGNRKVKLTLSGQVNAAVLYWDDGDEDDVYVIDSDESSSRIRLDAVGTISPGVTAGLVIEFDLETAGGGQVSAANDDNVVNNQSGGGRVQLRRANWFIQGSLGKISIGQGSQASDGAFEVSFSNAWLGSVGYGLGVTNIGGFQAQNIAAAAGIANGLGNGSVSWFAVGTDNDTGRDNRVRYDTPTFAGFTASVSWGEDDEYDAALRYANEFGGLKIAAAAAYNREEGDNPAEGFGELDRWGISAAIQFQNFHLQGGYSDLDVEGGTQREHYWVAAGVQFRASSLGSTDITVDYIRNENENLTLAGAVGLAGLDGISGSADDLAVAVGAVTGNVDYDSYGIGIGQNIDAVGGTLYLSYRHHEAELVGTNIDDEFDQVTFGMRLKY